MKINRLFTLIICFFLLANAGIGQQASEEMLVVFKRNTDIISNKYKQQLTAFKNLHLTDSLKAIRIEYCKRGLSCYSFCWDQYYVIYQFLLQGATNKSGQRELENRLFEIQTDTYYRDTVKVRWVSLK